MRDWSDNTLDELLEDALRSSLVTPQHKRRAWERLVAHASVQPMLPPAPLHFPIPQTTIPPQPLLRQVLYLLAAALSWLFDDTRYDRALRQRAARHAAGFHDPPLRNLLGIAI